ncbi:MAG TPA: FkbM family methyltransferase [Pyrinomonadaceae bacterium]|jgi:FkbM family methyltransferase
MLSHSLARFSASLPSSIKYRLATIRPAYNALLRLGQPLVEARTIGGPVKWRIDELSSQQYLLGTYEPYMQEAFAKFVRSGATVYDVGAHAGYHSLLCGLLVGPSGRVVAFEPNPKNRKSIERQLLANPGVPVSISPYALSDTHGTVQLDTSNGSSQGRVSDKGDCQVEARTIDYLVEHEKLPGPDVMKIDVEGHELNVLLGAVATIRAHRPIILCDPNDETTAGAVAELLGDLGYRVGGNLPIICQP